MEKNKKKKKTNMESFDSILGGQKTCARLASMRAGALMCAKSFDIYIFFNLKE